MSIICERNLASRIVMNSVVTLPHGKKRRQPKKGVGEHHAAVLRAEVVDDVTPIVSLLA